MEADDVIKEEEPEPEPDRFPLLMRKTQCPRCIGDDAMSVEERTFSYCRPAVMNDHFDREHLNTMEKCEKEGLIFCDHPKCRDEGLKLTSLNQIPEPCGHCSWSLSAARPPLEAYSLNTVQKYAWSLHHCHMLCTHWHASALALY